MSSVALPRPRPWTGLALTVAALALALIAFLEAGVGKTGQAPKDFALYGTLIGAGFVLGYLVIQKLAPNADQALYPVCGALAGIGFAVIFGITGDLAAEQATWMAVGLVAFALTLLIVRDHRQLEAYTYTIGLVGLALLFLPMVPGVGRTVNGARLWVGLGPIQFQPSELGKVFVVVFLAAYLDRNRELLAVATRKIGPFHLPQPKHLGPIVAAWGVSLALLFLEKDLGASLLYFAIFVVMLWVATGRGTYLIVSALLFAAGAFVAYHMFGHVQERVDVWLHALEPAKVNQFGFGQLAQSEFAMASGGLAGVGLGKGLAYLIPYSWTDFIFAEIGEELGLLGTTGVLLLYVVLVARGLRAALGCRDGFGQLLATGLSALIGIQAFVIVGGVTRLIPLTGITLPFVSYGGSSLLANFVILALLVRVSSGPLQRKQSRLGGRLPGRPRPAAAAGPRGVG